MGNSVHTKNRRVIFAIVWSIFSLIGILSFRYNTSLFSILFLYGFHTPRDCLYFTVGYGLYSDYPQLGLVFLFLFIVFVVMWIIAIFRINKNKLFEHLVWFDCLFSLIIYASSIILLKNANFTVYVLLVRILIENIIIIAIKIRRAVRIKRTHIILQDNTDNDSLS